MYNVSVFNIYGYIGIFPISIFIPERSTCWLPVAGSGSQLEGSVPVGIGHPETIFTTF
jgi:hypothetical protein